MDFEEYRLTGRAGYAALVEAIRQILAAAVKAQDMIPHAIAGRAKDPDSLEKKLKKRRIDPKSAIDEQIKDLAGIRIVFLTNAQVQRFLSSGIIHNNFEVVSVNVHHSVPGTESETRLFSSTNYFVQLKPERLALAEYAPFAGLKAEIQVQTLLNHAWAEMNHDTFYKEPAFRYVDRAQFERIRERMDSVMRAHLLPAGHDFDKISRDMALLMKTEEGFEPAVETIRTSKSNDEIAEAIETLDDVVMPRLAERGERFLTLLPDLIDAVNRTRGTPPMKIDTVLGSYDGESGEDVARKFASLLHHHRYCDPARTFSTLIEMYGSSETDGERSLWLDHGSLFAEHDLNVWREHGPAIQRIIVDGIAALDPNCIKRAHGIIVGMLGKVLSSEIGGASRGETLNTLVIHQGSVMPSEELKHVRADAISVLARLLAGASDDAERVKILGALREATRPPFHGGSAALRTVIMGDAARVVGIERTGAVASGLEVRRQMETAALNVHYWYLEVPADMADDDALVAAQQRVVSDAIALRDALNADEDYVLYKTLIGHDSVRPEAWDGDHFDPQATDEWRTANYPTIIARIDAEGTDAWCTRIRRYLSEPLAPGGVRPMADFSTRLANDRPEVAVQLLSEMDETLSPLLLALIVGLNGSGREDAVRHFAARWIEEGHFLATIADWLGSQNVSDPATLAAVVARARELGDDAAVLSAANAAARLWGQATDRRLIEDVFMSAVAYFTDVRQPGWIRHAWEIRNGGLVGALDEAQSRLLLQSFAEAPEIEYDADRILAIVADRRPSLIFDFFEGRVRRDRDKDGLRFNAVPFRIHELQKPLARHPDLLLAAARRWYDLDPRLHQFRGGKLVKNIFPTFPKDVADPLATIVATGDRDDLEFVLATLQPYEGKDEIYALCMDVVDRLEPGDEMLRRVSEVLGETGVVSGEFGFVEAESEQHARLGRYVSDPRPKVRAFVEAGRRHAEQSMAWEQRRAEQDVEQMRRDWD